METSQITEKNNLLSTNMSLKRSCEEDPNALEPRGKKLHIGDENEANQKGEMDAKKDSDKIREQKETALDSPNEELNENYELTKEIALDCEMVGTGKDGHDSILARVSLVNRHGAVLYDTFVRPTKKVTDYRTKYSGVRPADMAKGALFKVVQKQVERMICGKILVGHALENDLEVLKLNHPRASIRDTSKYRPFIEMFNRRTPSLKNLAERLLGIYIQEGEHSSVEDAQATMSIYVLHRKEWEMSINHAPQEVKYMMQNTMQASINKSDSHTERESLNNQQPIKKKKRFKLTLKKPSLNKKKKKTNNMFRTKKKNNSRKMNRKKGKR